MNPADPPRPDDNAADRPAPQQAAAWPMPRACATQRLYVLKDGDSFIVADAFGDVTGEGDGLFQNDTRLLSTFQLLINGHHPALLSSAVSQDNAFFTANLTNRPLPPLGESSMPQGVIHVERRRFLWRGQLNERIRLTNYSDVSTRLQVQLCFGADFRDMFEVRGQSRSRRGEMQASQLGERCVVLRYQGLDQVQREVSLSFSPQPQRLTARDAEFEVALGRRESWTLYVEVGDTAGEPSSERWRTAAVCARWSLRARRRRGARLRASGRLFQAWIDKSEADLALLTTELPTGPYPYAGIPWFSTPFGRDAVITAMQTLWVDPALARGVLAFLAAHQASEISTFRDAEPGKIMHETRKGEMAAVNELPFGQYYGGVDTTPLFVMLAAAYARRTGDHGFIDGIWSELVAATAWIEDNAARHGGLIGYARGEATGLANQGWKDSHDSVFHADGSSPRGPIALVEVQGYAYAALCGMARLAHARGDEDAAAHWKAATRNIAQRVEDAFWLEELQFYALALDGDGRPCRVRSSNVGHLLYSGLPRSERGCAVAKQLLSSTFDSGWGVRTLPTGTARFNPMSYHNGSVWPHDVALCAAGIARYGERDGALTLLDQLFEAASLFGMRLPELFCGFERAAGEAPVAYPVACLPQAWAAGAVFMLLQVILGVQIDSAARAVLIDRPLLPTGLESMSIQGIALNHGHLDLSFRRVGSRVLAVADHGAHGAALRIDLRL
jgi:glycogen debranching enzyme